MKIYHLLLCSTLVFAFSLSLANGQSKTPDVVYTKDGSIIKGTIIELQPNKSVKIQTSGGSMYMFQMDEVKQIVMGTTSDEKQGDPNSTAESEHPSSIYAGPNRPRFALFAGVSLPSGEFAEPGNAKTGFALGGDVTLPISHAGAWMTSVAASINSMDAATVSVPVSGLSVDAGSWTSVWLLTGLKISGDVSPDAKVFVFGQVGFLFGTTPEITVSAGSRSATVASSSANAFGYGGGAGVQFNHVVIGLRYVAGKPEYTLSASGGGGSASQEGEISTSCFLLTGGVIF